VILGFVFYFRPRDFRVSKCPRLGVSTAGLRDFGTLDIHYNYVSPADIYLYFSNHALRDEIFVYLQTRARHRPGPGSMMLRVWARYSGLMRWCLNAGFPPGICPRGISLGAGRGARLNANLV